MAHAVTKNDKTKGAYIGYGPKITKDFLNKQLLSTPCAQAYDVPSTKSTIMKSFGMNKNVHKRRDIRPVLMAGIKNPGPGYYHEDIYKD